MPLDIIIDFSAMLSYSKYVARILDEHPNCFKFAPSSSSRALDWADVPAGWSFQPPSYHLQDYYATISTNHVNNFLYSNKEHSHRWRSLRVLLPKQTDQDWMHPALYDISGNMENLLELEIRGLSMHTLVQAQQEVDSVSHFPSLRRFTTDQDLDLRQLSIGCSSLQHLCLNDLYASQRFLSTASADFVSLRSLQLKTGPSMNPFDPQEAVELPHLTSLKLSGENSLHENVINVLHVPNLVRLHLQSHVTWRWSQEDPVFQPLPSVLLTTVSMLLIEGPLHPADAIEFMDSSYQSLKVALQMASALVCLKMSGEWQDTTRIQQIVSEVRAQGNPLEFLEEIIIVQGGQAFSTQDEARYSFWWRPRDDAALDRVRYSEVLSNEAGQRGGR